MGVHRFSDEEAGVDLNNDFDPDNSMLPPSQRCKDQTDKQPTGPYQGLGGFGRYFGHAQCPKPTTVLQRAQGQNQDENTGISFNGVIKAYQPRVVPDEGENETDVEECIRRLEADDEKLEEVNINNMKRVPNTQKAVHGNTAIADSEARPLIELLEQSTSLKVLNIESNFISPELIARLLRATLETQSLVEFHAENQRASVLGNQIEMDIMLSVEDNENLLRVGVRYNPWRADTVF
uniref:Tropomodulin n=1 Tax=Ditylenchus dipsaci TaxID=166011 RepID=A0A915EFG0_9BILA